MSVWSASMWYLDDDTAEEAADDVAAPHIAGQHAVREQVHHLAT